MEAVLKMLEAFTGDQRYRLIEAEILEEIKKGKVFTMCEFAERMENKGIEKGIKMERKKSMQQLEQVKADGVQTLAQSLKKFGVSNANILNEIMEKYELSKAVAKKYI